MAAPLRNRARDEEVRARIQTTQLIKRLEEHVINDLDLKPSQVTAALGLLKKTTPDLANVELTGGDGGPVKMVIEWATKPAS